MPWYPGRCLEHTLAIAGCAVPWPVPRKTRILYDKSVSTSACPDMLHDPAVDALPSAPKALRHEHRRWLHRFLREIHAVLQFTSGYSAHWRQRVRLTPGVSQSPANSRRFVQGDLSVCLSVWVRVFSLEKLGYAVVLDRTLSNTAKGDDDELGVGKSVLLIAWQQSTTPQCI